MDLKLTRKNVKVRCCLDQDGEPWFCARDVAKALKYSVKSGINSLFDHVPDRCKGFFSISVPNYSNGFQAALMLNEKGLFHFLSHSTRPHALFYQELVAGEIMPSIRKRGGYLTSAKLEELLAHPERVENFLANLKKDREAARQRG
jgi:anti-repressor protein